MAERTLIEKLELMRLWIGDIGNVPGEAIAEIKRLTALAQSNHDIIWELTQERERLRAALREIATDEYAFPHKLAQNALDGKTVNEQLTP